MLLSVIPTEHGQTMCVCAQCLRTAIQSITFEALVRELAVQDVRYIDNTNQPVLVCELAPNPDRPAEPINQQGRRQKAN